MNSLTINYRVSSKVRPRFPGVRGDFQKIKIFQNFALNFWNLGGKT